MKREFIAVALLVLVLGLLLYNINVLDRKAETLMKEIDQAENLEQMDRKEDAAKKMEEALQSWLDWDFYSHIMLRHSEVDSVTECFYELLRELKSKDGASPATYDKVRERLGSIVKAEHITFHSVF